MIPQKSLKCVIYMLVFCHHLEMSPDICQGIYIKLRNVLGTWRKYLIPIKKKEKEIIDESQNNVTMNSIADSSMILEGRTSCLL